MEAEWENPEPQNELINGKEIITTKSVLICKATGMTIHAVTSGQEKTFAIREALIREMNKDYPGLYDILKNPYGSLYLNEGMYKKAIDFLEDRLAKNGGEILLPTIYDKNNPEGEMIRAALERLLPDCDTSAFDRFMNGLENTGVLNDMDKVKGWDVHYLNEGMIKMLRKDCAATDEKIKTDPFARWTEEHKLFTSTLADTVTQLANATVMYRAMQAKPVEGPAENPFGKLKEKLKNIGGKGGSEIRNRLGQPVVPTEKTLDMALDPETYANAIADKYGINLRGSGQTISISYNAEIASAGKTYAANPNVIELGQSAFVSEEELANTIAHELNHARSFLKGGSAPEWGKGGAYPAGDALAEYIRGVR